VEARSREQVLRLFGESAGSSVVVLLARNHHVHCDDDQPPTQSTRVCQATFTLTPYHIISWQKLAQPEFFWLGVRNVPV